MTRDFLSQAQGEIILIFNIQNRMYGGKYHPDDREWDIEPMETIILTDVSGEQAIIPLNATCITKDTRASRKVKTPDSDPPVAEVSSSSSAAEVIIGPDLPVPLTQLPPRLTGAFYDMLRAIMTLRPPISIVKTLSFDIPRYYAIGPANLPTTETVIMSIKLTNARSFNLYKYRVSGQGRRGLYVHIKNANQSDGWIEYPLMDRVYLLAHELTSFMRNTILCNLCPQLALKK